MRKCLNCEKELDRKDKTYCNNKCQNEFHYKEYIERWKSGEVDGMRGVKTKVVSQRVRRYLFEKNNNSCQICGWNKISPSTGKSPLEIHHKDGNHMNNSEENLELICPNCHSLTDNYKALNKSSSRDRRS